MFAGAKLQVQAAVRLGRPGWFEAILMAVLLEHEKKVREQAFTSHNNPKGNADTERMMRTLKEECLWLKKWTCPFELMNALEAWITTDNEYYLHSALGYMPPRQFEREYYTSHSTPFVAA